MQFGYLQKVLAGFCIVALCLTAMGESATAQQSQRTVKGERYVPTIWIDPDGCEHWVMDDGFEGYMSQHLKRDGKPVCHEVNLCGVMYTDQLFATNSASISAAGKQRLREFFRSTGAISHSVIGHTDSRASDEYNMSLSLRRANAVAEIARREGVRVTDVRGYGERNPKVPNTTAEGMAQNRRVEIMCWR